MYSKKWVSCLLIFSLLVTYLPVLPISAAEEKITVAVYELTAKEVSAGMVSILSDLLRDAIFQTGMFEMLTKEDMQRLLENMADKQQMGSDCDSDACIAEIAGALGVEMMITGSVGKVGKTYVISLRLIDTAVARTINTTSLTCPCEEDVLIERVKQAGLKLLKVQTEEQRKKQALTAKQEEAAAKKQAEIERKKQAEAAKKADKERKRQEAKAKKADKARQKELAKQRELEKREAAKRAKAERARRIIAEKEKKKKAAPAYEKKSSNTLWWVVGILLLGGGAAAAAAGGGGSSGGGGGGGGGSSGGGSGGGGGSGSGSVTVSW